MFKKTFAAIAVLASAMTLEPHAHAKEMRMLVGWSPSYPAVELTKVFAEAVKKSSAGALTIVMRGPEAVPPFEQLQPVAAGVFDLIFTTPNYHAGTSALALGLDATDPDSDKRRSVGAWAAVDAHYQKMGLKVLSLPVGGDQGFVILLRKPIGEDGGLKGRKIRGAPNYHPLITEFGGSPVVLPPNEIYSALEKGVVDGAAWPLFGPLQYKWHEVAGYLMQPTFGVVTHQILMSLAKWRALSENEQKLLLDQGRALETYSFKTFSERAAAEIAALKAAGVKITELGPDQKKVLNDIWAKGVWSIAEKVSGDDARRLRQMLVNAGMTK